MIHSKDKSGEDIKSFCTEFRKYPSTCSSNHIKEDEFIEWGANVVIYANHLLRASFPAMQNVVHSILENKRSFEVNEDCMSIKEILELIPGK